MQTCLLSLVYLRSPSHPATAGQLPTEPRLHRNLQMRSADRRNSKRVRFPSGICENESCRRTLHKPPNHHSSITIKLRISTQQRTFSLYSLSCFSQLSLNPPPVSLPLRPPSPPALSASYASGCICVDASSTMKVNYCSYLLQACHLISSANIHPVLLLLSRNFHCQFHFLHDSDGVGAEMHTHATGTGATKAYTGPVVPEQ